MRNFRYAFGHNSNQFPDSCKDTLMSDIIRFNQFSNPKECENCAFRFHGQQFYWIQVRVLEYDKFRI